MKILSQFALASGKSDLGEPFEITLSPYQDGREEAEAGTPFCPELIWGSGINGYTYACGFLAVRPDCEAALAFAENYEQVQYEIARGEEPEYKPVLLDFEIDF